MKTSSGVWATELPGLSQKIVFGFAILAICGFTFAMQWFVPQVTDVSWLFVVGERVFGGEKLYVDIMETNPPITVLLYLPTLALSHVSGLSPEFLQIFLTMLLAFLSIGWTSRILKASGQIEHVSRYRILGLLVVAALPLGAYSEREHFALLLSMPALAVIAARALGRDIGWGTAVLAGLGEGLAVAIKPQMAFPILLAVAYGMIYARSPRLAFRLEHWVGAAVACAYLGLVIVVYPEFITVMMPILQDTYRAVRFSFADMALSDGAIAVYALICGLILLSGKRALEPRLMVPILATLGYFASHMEQSKGWAYHLYPGVALIALTFANEMIGRLYAADLSRIGGRALFALRFGAVLALIAGSYPIGEWLSGRQWDSFPLAEQIRRFGDHPTIGIISDDLGLTHPLTRMVNGQFVGTVASQWITSYARFRLQHHGLDADGVRRMNAWVDYDRALLAKDFARQPPKFIVVDRGGFDWLDWARQSPDLAKLLADYRQAGRANDIYLLARPDIAPNEPHPATGRFWRLGSSDRWRGLEHEDLKRVIQSAQQ